MRYVTSEEIESLNICPVACVEWIKESFMMKSESTLPPKISIHPQNTDFINTMPCLLPERFHCYGCKIVSRINGSNPALKSNIILIDSSTGDTIAIVDGEWITAMRTGAVTALTMDTLKCSSAKVYAFVGLGVIGNATLECFLTNNDNQNIIVRLKRYKNHAERIAKKYSCYTNVTFELVDSTEELVDGADVIVSCITEAHGFLVKDLGLFKPGVLVIPVHTRGFQNCDTVFDKVFADDEGHVRNFKYFNQFKKFGEIGDVINGEIPGRENDFERILSYNIGLGLHDVLFADKIIKLLDKDKNTITT